MFPLKEKEQEAEGGELGGGKRESEFPHLLFCSFWVPTNWRTPTHIGKGEFLLLDLMTQMRISSGNIFKDTPINNVLPSHLWHLLSQEVDT